MKKGDRVSERKRLVDILVIAGGIGLISLIIMNKEIVKSVLADAIAEGMEIGFKKILP